MRKTLKKYRNGAKYIFLQRDPFFSNSGFKRRHKWKEATYEQELESQKTLVVRKMTDEEKQKYFGTIPLRTVE